MRDQASGEVGWSKDQGRNLGGIVTFHVDPEAGQGMAGLYVRKPGVQASDGCEGTGQEVNDCDRGTRCGNGNEGEALSL